MCLRGGGVFRLSIGSILMISVGASGAFGQPATPTQGTVLPSRAGQGGVFNFAALAAAPSPSVGPVRVHQHGRISRYRPTASNGSPVTPPPARPLPPLGPLPGPGQSFLGLIDNNQAIPPDTEGAVGPNHVFTTLNSQYIARSKTGTQSAPPVTMDTFWSATGHSSTFDPRVLYDTGSGRWIASAAAANADNTNSVGLIGASATNDPTGAWIVCAVLFDPVNTTRA